MAHGKVILFGEHSVVYGKNAIAMHLKSVKMEAKITTINTNENVHVKHIKEYIKSNYNILDEVYVEINSNIPRARGLGSSAALAVSVARAFKERYNLTDENVFDIVNESERWAHGNPSGIDIAVILNEKNVLFNKKEGIRNIDIDLNSKLLIIDSGIKGSTKKAVSMVSNNLDEYKGYIEKLGKITDDAIAAIVKKNLKLLGELMNSSHNLLRNMNLSNDVIENIINICNEYALGSKITGAGLGGCVIALIENEEKAYKLINILKEKGVSNIWLEDI
ncbi:mevalonate kinase [Streptobacillus felis]|uniref:mevalonate kinase n=1 Tax=Streptobacillus felis TaxID=1384509 RepID=A0A7Z0PF98_9FUSO|nr:mevalonate kinase [Streptobacillus felis]NYV28151.1 mevalonate kinase [Streptobacillus felis]